MAPDPDAIFFRPPCLEDLPALLALETASYPPDEAATREKLAMRIEDAADVFMVAMRPADSAIVGFVCGTCTAAAGLTHESMSTHDPEGQLLCVHRQVPVHLGEEWGQLLCECAFTGKCSGGGLCVHRYAGETTGGRV